MTAVTPEGTDTGIGFTFTVTFKSPCHDATLTYLPSNWPAPYEYIASLATDTQTVLATDVTSTELDATCPWTKEFQVYKRDGSALDTSVFNFNPATLELATFTNDPAKIGVHLLTLKVQYLEHGTIATSTNIYDFQIEVIDPCINNAVLTA